MKPEFTDREVAEITFALLYDKRFSHGTDGHHRLKLIAKLARWSTNATVISILDIYDAPEEQSESE